MEIQELPPEYLSALARQFGFLGAFLGGVSATLFVTLLTLATPSKVVRWAIGLAAVAAAAFIVTAYMSVGVVANTHPGSPTQGADTSFKTLQILMSLSFAVGILTLLGAIGVSGWSRSKTLGYVTSGAAFLAALPVLLDVFV